MDVETAEQLFLFCDKDQDGYISRYVFNANLFMINIILGPESPKTLEYLIKVANF